MDLLARRCEPVKGVPPLAGSDLDPYLALVPTWANSDGWLCREFGFRNFHETMAFVNAAAWIAHSEDHHPDLEVGYKRCLVRYRTHSIDGLSDNDFICAAKIDALISTA